MAPPTLLSLPPELRNRIYELVVVSPAPLKAALSVDYAPANKKNFGDGFQVGERVALLKVPWGGLLYSWQVQPPLTKVNRQVRSEALPVFHGLNSFQFHKSELTNTENLAKWWNAFTTDTTLQHIKHVVYAFEGFFVPAHTGAAGPRSLSSQLLIVTREVSIALDHAGRL